MGFFKKVLSGKTGKTLGGGLIMGPLGSLLGASSGGGGGDGSSIAFGDPNAIANEERNRILAQNFEDDQAAYDQALKAAGEQATFDEQRGTDAVLGRLQGRGLARSGIALKDVIDQVLGPSLMRQNNLAASFGLQKAQRRSDLLQGQRDAVNQIGMARLGGATQGNFLGLQDQIAQRNAMDDRRRQRQGAIMGLVGGGLGALIGGPGGAYVGSQIGSRLAS